MTTVVLVVLAMLVAPWIFEVLGWLVMLVLVAVGELWRK